MNVRTPHAQRGITLVGLIFWAMLISSLAILASSCSSTTDVPTRNPSLYAVSPNWNSTRRAHDRQTDHRTADG